MTALRVTQEFYVYFFFTPKIRDVNRKIGNKRQIAFPRENFYQKYTSFFFNIQSIV